MQNDVNSVDDLNPNIPDRELIRQYFEYLENKRNATITTIKEPLAKRILSYLIEKQRWNFYLIVLLLLLLIFIYPVIIFWSIIIFLGLFLIPTKRTILPNFELPVEEKYIDKWLWADKKSLRQKVPQRLNVKIYHKSSTNSLNEIIYSRGPILISSGADLDKLSDLKREIIGKYYFYGRGDDGKIRYSIHEIYIICLCKNFLAYYKCYWNFLFGISTLVETGEYLYDQIVSVNTEELSSVQLGNNGWEKLRTKEFLRISTTDGKEIKLPGIPEVRRISKSKSADDESTVRDAADVIRRLLRQRRIDLQLTKAVDSVFEESNFEE